MTAEYSIPMEARKCLVEGILNHSCHRGLPAECYELSKLITFVGDDQPKMAINWRFAESVSSLKGFEAIMINLLLERKYGVQPQEVTINTDHAQLFIMSFHLVGINPNPADPVEPLELRELNRLHSPWFKSWDLYH